MNDTDILVIRKMLRILIDLGPAGIQEPDLKEQAEIAAGRILADSEKDLAVKVIKDRHWIASYREPITDRLRWYPTPSGIVAYSSL
jgi:hypothetical protein